MDIVNADLATKALLSPLERLPFDIIDRLLFTLPTVDALQSAVLSSVCFHETYAVHPKEILTTVVFNELGPALYHARALYHASPRESEGVGKRVFFANHIFYQPEYYFTGSVSMKEARQLSYYHDVATRLEACFSLLWKDRTTSTSQLTATEKFYFQRALYRYWLLTVQNRLSEGIWVFVLQSKLEGFFRTGDADDSAVRQFRDVHVFLCQLSRTPTYGTWETLYPDEVLQMLDDDMEWRSAEQSDSFRVGLDIHSTLENVYEERELPSICIWDDAPGDGLGILTDGSIHSFKCPECQTKRPRLLFGESNWHLLKYFCPVTNIPYFLRGKLSNNSVVERDFEGYKVIPHYSAIILREIREGVKDNDNSLVHICLQCMFRSFKQGALDWYIQKKATENLFTKPACSFGWYCEEQSRDQHAEEFNHLCPPVLDSKNQAVFQARISRTGSELSYQGTH